MAGEENLEKPRFAGVNPVWANRIGFWRLHRAGGRSGPRRTKPPERFEPARPSQAAGDLSRLEPDGPGVGGLNRLEPDRPVHWFIRVVAVHPLKAV
jgi:hypothetical protein